MSLRAVHICFISLSTLLAFGFGLWAVRSYPGSGNPTSLGLGIASFLGGIFLIGYLFWFIWKMKRAEPR